MNEFRSFILVQAVLVVLHGLDLLTTYLAITRGVGQEANPFMAHVLVQYGWAGMAVAKAFFAGAFAVVAVSIKARAKKESSCVTLDACTFVALTLMTFVVSSNAMIVLS